MSAILGAPSAVVAALARLQDDLVRTAGKNLAGLILYGGLARGRFRPGKSDVNVIVLLHDAAVPALAAIAPALRAARRAAAVVPMILMPTEALLTAVVFPTKFLDIKDHHIVLYGADPFAALEVPREQIRLRVVQELRNLTLRLRARFVAAFDDRAAQKATLTDLARPLAVELIAMLRLAGKDVPSDDSSPTIFKAAAAAFGADGEALASLAALRHGGLSMDDLTPLFTHLLATLSLLIDCAERIKESA